MPRRTLTSFRARSVADRAPALPCSSPNYRMALIFAARSPSGPGRLRPDSCKGRQLRQLAVIRREQRSRLGCLLHPLAPARSRAKTLAQALEQRGFSTWWDRKISFGKAYDEVITDWPWVPTKRIHSPRRFRIHSTTLRRAQPLKACVSAQEARWLSRPRAEALDSAALEVCAIARDSCQAVNQTGRRD